MNSRFTFLDQLETDLRRAAEREQHWSGQQLAPARRSPERWRPGWVAIAAAFVALLVVAGAIGVLSQLRARTSAGAPAAGVAATGPEPAASASRAPAGNDWGARSQEVPGLQPAAAQPAPAGTDVSYHAVDKLSAGVGASGGGKPIPQQDLSKIIRDGPITVVVP